MLICGVYHPPLHNYQETSLRSCIIDLEDSILESFADGLFVSGGDLNQMDITRFESLSGWRLLVSFPTRGESCLDNCFTNNPGLFNLCYPIQMLTKTDHKGLILPRGIKLKPLRYKVQLRDCREHRKANLYSELEQVDWGFVLEANKIEDAVTSLETKILELLNACMPLRIEKMSSRDPFWMSPLIKYLLKIKAKVTGSHKDLLKRISKAIMDNTDRLNSANGIESREWWKTTNAICSYKASSRCTLSEAEIRDLNCFFGHLCTDNRPLS